MDRTLLEQTQTPPRQKKRPSCLESVHAAAEELVNVESQAIDEIRKRSKLPLTTQEQINEHSFETFFDSLGECLAEDPHL